MGIWDMVNLIQHVETSCVYSLCVFKIYMTTLDTTSQIIQAAVWK